MLGRGAWLGVTYRSYLLAVLMAILAFSYVERMVFGIALQDIKTDFHLTDTQLGILNGLVFAFFFAALGVPIARWSDRGNRIAIVSLATAVWGVTVSLCAVASGFLHLLLLRIGTAAGEAGCSPPAHSLIPGYFSRAERARAVSRYMLGVPIGLTVGYFAGGWLNELCGWRVTFVAIGLPGALLAALAMFTLKEPRRPGSMVIAEPPERSRTTGGSAPSLGYVLRKLSGIATFRHLMVFYLLWYISGWTLGQWQATFFIRSHGMATGELGTWLAVTHGVGGAIGTWLGGEFCARYAAHDEGLQFRAIAVSFLIVALLYVVVHIVLNKYVALAAVTLATLGGAVAQGPIYGAIQTLVPPSMRATAVVLIGLLPSFVGMGLGPLGAGVLSDALRPSLGNESMRYALIAFCPGFAWAAWHLYRASRTVAADLAMIEIEPTRQACLARDFTE